MPEENLFIEAKKYIPGGVNSPVRAFKAVGGTPIFFKRAKGCYMYDSSDREYIDYIGSWGPMILGHAHPDVISSIKSYAECGLSFGAPTEIETEMAKRITELIPSIEKVRMVSSGTEAAMSAIRLARGYTNRDKLIKFEGCYHGHADSLLVKAGSGALTLGVPTSPGIPSDLAQHTITLNYNDSEQIKAIYKDIGDQIAAVIVEPVAGNMNCIPSTPEFLQSLRKTCSEYGSVLIFDEVMSGFRVALGGAQSIYDIAPDLTILGKIIGGGMPVGALGGKAEIMDYIAPDGPVYQAGTLSGNPMAMAAGLTTLKLISENDFFEKLSKKSHTLVNGICAAANAAGVSMTSNQIGGMFGLFFSDEPLIKRFTQVMNCNSEQFSRFFHLMLNQGIYLAPSSFEAGFVSSAHSEKDIQKTIDAAIQAFKRL